MKVYVVEVEYEWGARVVFSTREKAEAYVASKSRELFLVNYVIEEFELDELPD